MLALIALSGCSKKASADEAGGATAKAIDLAAAKKVFAGRCVQCHGNTGNGDGPGAAALKPKPRAFKNAKWQASVTDEHIKTTITKGGLAVGKSPIMPGQPDLKSKPAVLNGLVKIIRDFKK